MQQASESPIGSVISKTTFSADVDPYKTSGRIDDLAFWAPIEYPSIYAYPIDSTGELFKRN